MPNVSLGDLIISKSAPAQTEELHVEEWDCAVEIKRMLESIGVYDDIKSLMHIIRVSKDKRSIDIAKNKLDAISKIINIAKNSTTIYEQSTPEDDDGFSRVIVDISRKEDERQEEDT